MKKKNNKNWTVPAADSSCFSIPSLLLDVSRLSNNLFLKDLLKVMNKIGRTSR